FFGFVLEVLRADESDPGKVENAAVDALFRGHGHTAEIDASGNQLQLLPQKQGDLTAGDGDPLYISPKIGQEGLGGGKRRQGNRSQEKGEKPGGAGNHRRAKAASRPSSGDGIVGGERI